MLSVPDCHKWCICKRLQVSLGLECSLKMSRSVCSTCTWAHEPRGTLLCVAVLSSYKFQNLQLLLPLTAAWDVIYTALSTKSQISCLANTCTYLNWVANTCIPSRSEHLMTLFLSNHMSCECLFIFKHRAWKHNRAQWNQFHSSPLACSCSYCWFLNGTFLDFLIEASKVGLLNQLDLNVRDQRNKCS